MASLNFQKPDKIILQKATDFEAQFEFRPLEPGYGVTIGNALRRVLLNSLEGYAIVGVKIEGVEHEFATMKYDWLTWDNNTMTGTFIAAPHREQIPENIKEQLIVELYNK